MHSSFYNYRKQSEISDSDIDDESIGSDDNLTKEASLIEASFVDEDSKNLYVKGNISKALGASFFGNNNKTPGSGYKTTQKVTAVLESSSEDDECNGNGKPRESPVDSEKRKSKHGECDDDESAGEKYESAEESADESLVVARRQKKKAAIISSDSDSDKSYDEGPSLPRWPREREAKPVAFHSGASKDEVVRTPAEKSRGRTSASRNVRDSKESSRSRNDERNANSSRAVSIETSSDDGRHSARPSITESDSEDSGSGGGKPPSGNDPQVDDRVVSLISSDSDEHPPVRKPTKRDAETTEMSRKPCAPHQSPGEVVADKVIDLTRQRREPVYEVEPSGVDATKRDAETTKKVDPRAPHQSRSVVADKVIDLTGQRREPVYEVQPSGVGTWLNTQKIDMTSKVKTEAELPLKPATQLNGYAHMVSVAELQMLETNISLKKKDLQTNNNILMQVNLSTLPDKGRKLQMRSLDLEKEVKELERQRTLLQSQMSNPSSAGTHVLQPGELARLKPQPPSWKEIRKTADVQHGYGVKAMENYHAEKAATLEVLRHLHNSLKTRPDPTTLAPDPQELRSDVKLMPHQRHALAWMMWRETESPAGGILADDMGLGKTLTMISLVLKCAEENIVKGSSDSDLDDDSKENKSSYKSKHRSTNGGTLVVCPASLLSQWAGEVKRRVNGGVLDVELHHGSNRETRPHRLARYAMVVTTYAIVMNEHSRKGPLHQVKWQRIILDEAHTVRNHKSLTSIAVVELKAHCRWALTGTPIHNKELDMFALLKFLRCSPFDDLPVWKKWVDNKSENGMKRLNTVMNSIMLRRTKEQLQEEKSFDCLPEKKVEHIDVKLDTDEFAVYEKVLIFSRALMSEFLLQKAEKDALLSGQAYTPLNFRNTKPEDNPFGANTKLGSMHQKMTSIQDVKSFHILVLLLRLRQICCHPGLIKKMLDQESADQDGIEDKDGLDIDLVAQINKMSLSEQHGPDFDPDSALDEDDNILKPSNPVFSTERASSKMRAVFECLEKNIKGTQDKAVVVSQWPSMLMLMGSHLKEMHIKCTMLTGAVPVKDRPKIVDDFNKVGHGPQVLLLSLTAGGVGLNLVGGNHLLLCDLHWNPQLEAQACDRVYRLGQKKTVNIYKFVCEDTIEQKIKNIQGKKLAIATGILSGVHKSQGSKLTLDDLKTIFSL